MALIKHDGGYNNGWKIITGDDDFDSEFQDQLSLTPKELANAIVKAGVSDQLFEIVIAARSKTHDSLAEKFNK